MNHQDIAVVLYNNLPNTCANIEENLCDLTRFKFGGQYQYKIFDTKNITETLTKLSSTHKWAVIAAAGTTIREQAQIQQTVEHAIAQQSPLSCHILDRQGYFHFHPQWFAVDLSVYKEIGCPPFEEQRGNITLNTLRTERSLDNVHDDYTPWWLHSHPEPASYTCDYQGFGIQVIAKLISAGYNITNVPTSVRERKNYCYPEHNAEGIKRIIEDPNFVPEDSKSPLFWFHHEVSEMTRSLSVGYYVLNTEPLNDPHSLKIKQFDCFAGVASGVKPACIVGQDNFDPESHVVLFDISPAAIKWQKFLLAEWDGNFDKLEGLLNQFKFDNPDLRPIYYQHQSFKEIIDWFFSLTKMTPESFQQAWNKYKNMNVEFVNVNLLENHQPVLDAISKSKKGAYIWTSNLFNMDYLSFYKTHRWTNAKFDEFNNVLASQDHVPVAFENCNITTYFNVV
jgi:hypothetical protein